LLNVANTFLQVLNKENLKVQNEQLGIDQSGLLVHKKVNAGTIPEGDLFDVKTTLASDNKKN
jgi:hypothetical protein